MSVRTCTDDNQARKAARQALKTVGVPSRVPGAQNVGIGFSSFDTQLEHWHRTTFVARTQAPVDPPSQKKNPIAHFSIGRSGIFGGWTENRQNARLTLDGHCRSCPFTTLFLHLNHYESQATESFRGDCVCRQFFADKTVRSARLHGCHKAKELSSNVPR